MIDPKDVTIIIPHLGGTPESEYALDQCLESLADTVPDINFVLSTNGDKECKHKKYFNYIHNTEQGQCKAVNAAVATTNTPWIFVTNDDMIYPPGWWDKLVGGELGIGLNPDAPTCISPKLVEPRPGAPTFQVFFAGGAGGDFNKEAFLGYASTWEGGGIQKGFNLPFLIKRELWDTVGGYDINYDPWGSNSDSDLEYKIKLAGVQPYQNTNCIVYHFSQTSGTFNPENGAHYQHNFAVFKDKWGFDRTDDGIWQATFEIPNEGRKFRPSWEGKYA